MADTVKQIGVKQQDGTYSMKDIEVDYSNVAGLSTQATSAKATADKNNKDITTYIASGSKNGENLVLIDGAGTTSNVDLSMTGATSNANGVAGFVPQPTSADVDKFLKADGSWATPPGEHYSGSSNINIDSSNNIDLTNTTVSSGTYGPSADVVGNNGTTILVPNISVDAKGRVTNITNKTYTSVDTGSKVFTGSLQEWDQLTIAQKKTYDFISNEDPGGTQGTFPADRVSYDNTVSGLTATDVQGAVDEMHTNFQAGVDDIYDAVVAKGSTPASHSLSDVVAGITAIPTGITPTGTLDISSNGVKDVIQYASANVNVPNSNSGTYTPTSITSAADMGVTNSYRYVNTTKVPCQYYASANWYSTIKAYTTNITVTVAGTYYIFATCWQGATFIVKQGSTTLYSGGTAWYAETRSISANTVMSLSCNRTQAMVLLLFRIGS